MKLLIWLNILSWYFEVVWWVLFIEFCKLPRYLTLWALLSDHLCGEMITVYTSKPISDLRKTSVYHKYFVVRYYLLEAPILFFTCKSQIVINGAVFFSRIKFTRFSTVCIWITVLPYCPIFSVASVDSVQLCEPWGCQKRPQRTEHWEQEYSRQHPGAGSPWAEERVYTLCWLTVPPGYTGG